MSTWLITGCSTGLGRALAEAILGAGHNAVITARNPATLAGLAAKHPGTALALPLDVRDHEQVTRVAQQAAGRFGGIDVLVNNAGHGYRSAIEEAGPAEVQELIETNFLGPVDLIRQVLPGMRQRRSGTIINVSSIAGRMSSPGSGYYSATKMALEGASDALRQELAPRGIQGGLIFYRQFHCLRIGPAQPVAVRVVEEDLRPFPALGFHHGVGLAP